MDHFLTSAGMNLLLRGLCGEQIVFTKIKLGNGPEQDDSATDLSNPLLEVEISEIEREETHVTLSAAFRNSEVSDGFTAKEIGVFVRDPDNAEKEFLYGLWYEPDEAKADYVPAVTDRVLETQMDILVFVGEAENVSASISSSLIYATTAELEKHTKDTENPHKVTKQQIGLGNVENKSISEQEPVFDSVKTLTANESGEKIGTVFAKVSKAIEALIAHLTALNPHGITANGIGAAAKAHYHSANQINSGTLPVARGGTGSTSMAALAGKVAAYFCVPIIGSYTGDGTQGREIELGFQPKAVLLFDANGNTNDDVNGYAGGLALPGLAVSAGIGSVTYDATWSDSYSVLMITENGFKVNYYSNRKVGSNVDGMTYRYIAFKG